jgi:hypothetical protein
LKKIEENIKESKEEKPKEKEGSNKTKKIKK